MGSASAGGGTRLGSVPVISAERCALGCGASTDVGAGVGAGACVDAGPDDDDDAGAAGVGAKSVDTVIEAGASDSACGSAGGSGGPLPFGTTGAAVSESGSLFDGALGAVLDGAEGAGTATDPVVGASAVESASGTAGDGNGRSVTAGASIASRSP
jgi:hypothetical protein